MRDMMGGSQTGMGGHETALRLNCRCVEVVVVVIVSRHTIFSTERIYLSAA